MAPDAELIRMIEDRVRPRCVTNLFLETLWHDCLTSSNPIVVAGGHAYRASNDLAELCVSDARARLRVAATLLESADIADSPLIAWWVYNLGGDAADEALDLPEAYRLFSKAAILAERKGLAEAWIRSLVNRIYLLTQTGRSRELIIAVKEMVATEAFNTAAVLKASALAEVLAWLGQPGLSAQARGQAAEVSATPSRAAVAQGHIANGDLGAAEAILAPDLLQPKPSNRFDPQAHASHLLAAVDLRIKQSQLVEAQVLANIADQFLSTRDSAKHTNLLRLQMAEICQLRGDSLEALDHLALVNDAQTPTDDRLKLACLYVGAYTGLERWTEAARWHRKQIERSKQRSPSALEQAELIDILVSSEFASVVSGPVEKRLAELRETLLEREAMTSVVAKDLRGPIFALELATTMSESAPSSRVSHLMDASQTALELAISKLTDLDFLESFDSTGPMSEVDVCELAVAGAELARPVLRGGVVELEFPPTRRRPKVVGHGELLARVVAYAIVDVATHAPGDAKLRLVVGDYNNVVTITIQTADTSILQPSEIGASSPVIGREQFVLNRIVQLIGGRLHDSSTSDRDRLVRLSLPIA